MKKKFNLFKNNFLDNLPEDHPIFRIHVSIDRPATNERSVLFFDRAMVFMRFIFSSLCVFVVLVPSDILRFIWALVLNVFSNHWTTYWYFIKRFYLVFIQEIVSGIFYFLVLMPYGILAKFYRWPLKTDSSNTDSTNARYQS